MEYSSKVYWGGIIRCIKKENGGVSSARNAALKEVSGDYVMFVDADDYLVTGTLPAILQKAYKEDAVVVKWGFRSVKADDNAKVALDRDIVFKKKRIDPQRTPSSVRVLMVRRDVIFDHAVFFNERLHYGEDALFHFFVYLFSLGRIMIETEARIYNYRILSTSLSHAIDTNTWQRWRVDNMLIRIEACRSIDNKMMNDKQKRALSRKINQYVSNIIIQLLKCPLDYTNKKLKELKEKGLYPYHPLYAISEYDSENNALTFKDEPGYWKLLINHWAKSVIYSLGIILISNEYGFKFARRLVVKFRRIAMKKQGEH